MNRLAGAGALVFAVNTAYIAAFATPSIFYMASVVLHVVIGIALAALLAWMLLRNAEWRRRIPSASQALLAAAVLLGLFLVLRGSLLEHRWALYGHIGAGVVGVLLLARLRAWRARVIAAVALLAVLPAATWMYRRANPNPNDRIRNPKVIPASMEEEGAGPKSPFWPSSADTNTKGLIPSTFFLDSKLCGECHKDIYDQWNSSAHHFGSFNNQFYRKSIEYMQSLAGTKPTKWCAGCHDHAVFFNGRFEKPIVEQIDTEEAQAGLGCVSCHMITRVDGSMGNGGFTIEYPELHELAASKNPWMRKLDRFLTYLDPEPHRRTFMKPFMRLDSPEYCSTCHKVHLDVPVNNYRWIRGFNDYDNWQASGVSGQGARSFYYPAKSSTCTDCHMPLVPSRDPGHRDGQVHSHRFAAANMAVAYANKDAEQMRLTEEFLKSGFISVDIFAASPVEEMKGEPQMLRRSESAPQQASTFAVGEEAEQGGHVFLREVGNVAAPIDQSGVKFEPGSTVRVDVVVRTRKIGHFFPGGTVDSFDVWLELTGDDADGKRIFWSGMAEDNGRGPVEKGAHFYRAYLLDAEGNPINKRNAFQARSVLYVRLIPPGAADVAHYRVKIPSDARGPIKLHAKLNYRKFSHYYTQFSYAGVPGAGTADRNHDSRSYTFLPTNIPKNVSGQIKDHIPNVPIVTMAEARAELPVRRAGEKTAWKPVVRKNDRERWNDWGIGMLLQGDLKGAEYAFRKVTEAEPEYADGWLNVARALIQEGETDAAKPFLERALAIDSKLGRIHFFKAMVQKADGDYDGALASLRTVSEMYPRDRVVLNQMGRILFLNRQYADAVKALERVLEIDPEDVQAHYNLALAYRGLGRAEQAARSQKLFLRFKADESSQAITAKPRMLSPEDNNERQMIHDHESALTR
jgi:tetratricopeptide (TPR) repeat protein